MKKFSFVIPTYQNKRLLKNTLEALNYQRDIYRGNYEAVVVDDGSTDGTCDYIQGVNRSYDLKYKYLERCGSSCRAAARNRGWEEASGEIIVFIDSDILVRDDYLSELDRCFSMDSNMVVIGQRLMLKEELTLEDMAGGNAFREYRFDAGNLEAFEVRHFAFDEFSYNASAMNCPWYYVHGCNMAVPRALLEKAGGFDENFKGWGHEDVELGYRLYKEGARIIINSKLEALHQFHVPVNVNDKNMLAGIDENTAYFLRKHPQAINMSRKDVFELFRCDPKARKNRELDLGEPLPEKVIRFKDMEKLSQVKEEILELSSKEGLRPVVYDYVEATDLDIWIQLLGKRKSTPRYYPMSRRIDL